MIVAFSRLEKSTLAQMHLFQRLPTKLVAAELHFGAVGYLFKSCLRILPRTGVEKNMFLHKITQIAHDNTST